MAYTCIINNITEFFFTFTILATICVLLNNLKRFAVEARQLMVYLGSKVNVASVCAISETTHGLLRLQYRFIYNPLFTSESGQTGSRKSTKTAHISLLICFSDGEDSKYSWPCADSFILSHEPRGHSSAVMNVDLSTLRKVLQPFRR